MLSNVAIAKMPLPKNWSRRVRSAVVHMISRAQTSLTHARSFAANSINARIRLKAEFSRLRQEILLLREELRIKDVRIKQIPAQRRPHYPPVERLAILELRAARAWSQAQTAEQFLTTPATIASWMGRLDEEGPHALVQIREPVNRFPDFVSYLVRRLKALCPTIGKSRIANVLCRAGLHLGASTIRRMLNESKRRKPLAPTRSTALGRIVTARHPNHILHADLTTVPTSLGFWVSWLPFSLPQIWPFCWWVALVVDHFSRQVLGIAVFKKEPTSLAVRRLLDRVICQAGVAPDYLITDKGLPFTAKSFNRWRRHWRIRHCFGAAGKYRSVAVIERLMRTRKTECTRRLAVVPFRQKAFERELSLWTGWHNRERPHQWLGARTPDEVYFGLRCACHTPRFEPRARWPRRSPCAMPQVLVRGRPGAEVDLEIKLRQGRRHLPVVAIRRAA